MTRATGLGLGAVVLWAALALVAVGTVGLPPFQVTAITFAIGGLAGLAVVIARREMAALRQPPMAWLLGVGGLFGYHALFFAAMKLAPPAEANLINYLWPLMIVLFSGLLPGHRLAMRHLAGAALGFAGVIILTLSRGGVAFTREDMLGYGLALGCAVVWSSYSVLSRRMTAVPTAAVAGFCLATAVLAAACHVLLETWVNPTGFRQWAWLVGAGLGPVGAAFFLWDIGVKKGDISFLGVASFATPVLSTLLLVLAGAAPFSAGLVLSCALIVLGAVVATRAQA